MTPNYVVKETKKPCPFCGKPIQPGQLWLASSGAHVFCPSSDRRLT